MKKEYFYDWTAADEMSAVIIDLETLEAAERGENYLNPNNFSWLGEFDSPEAARYTHTQQVAESWYCREHDC